MSGKPPETCDLSSGIVADDRAGTVTFHLTQPDPDFLYKLTLAYADVLPASAPAHQARTRRCPPPVHTWSAATGPARICCSCATHGSANGRPRAARRVSRPDPLPLRPQPGPGGGLGGPRYDPDLMANLGPVPGDTSYFQHHPGQLRSNSQALTSFIFLNVNTPPFNDIRVRQAVNLALDRRRIADDYGGPLSARPTCQILPPGLAGYQPYCPWTRQPATDGNWEGPDLARARRLVADSGTAGMSITVWNTPAPQAAVDETEELIRALHELGYRASLRILPDDTYFSYTNDSRNHPQVIDGGWSADYPSADDFIGKLDCDHFVPANGPATTDAAEFCNPAVDRQIARAAAAQTTDATAAAAVGAARPPAHRPGDPGSHRRPQSGRSALQPHG